tara:strand:- start:4383 stop:4787 length:405 start_codon:yes stop_codon:yes gene_type:complete
MAYGIKISLPTFNVATATTEQLSITSEKSMLKQERKGTTTYTFSGSPASATILTVTHNLGYIPAAVASWYRSSLNVGGMLPYNDFPYNGVIEIIRYEMNTTQFIIKYESEEFTPTNRNGQVWTFDYTIWYDDAF